MPRLLKTLLLVFLLTIIFFIGFFLFPDKTSSPAQILQNNQKQIKPDKNETIEIIIVGDIMLDRGVKYMIDKYQDFKWPFLKIADELKKTDILFGNLESPISDKGEKQGSIYSFRAVPEVIEGLVFAGFDILSLANNHAFDYGIQALKDTLSRLHEHDIDYVGAGFNEEQSFSPVIKEIKETKIGFLAYTNLGPWGWKASQTHSGISWISENDFERITQDIKKTKEETNILIVSLHSGEEYQKTPTDFQVSFAKISIQAGADIIIQHHPHVVQKSEKYLNGYIFYSLGNFIFDQGFSEETMQGQIIKIIIEDKKIKQVIPIEIKINNSFQPEIHSSTNLE